jgi:hypothetical protein
VIAQEIQRFLVELDSLIAAFLFAVVFQQNLERANRIGMFFRYVFECVFGIDSS